MVPECQGVLLEPQNSSPGRGIRMGYGAVVRVFTQFPYTRPGWNCECAQRITTDPVWVCFDAFLVSELLNLAESAICEVPTGCDGLICSVDI